MKTDKIPLLGILVFVVLYGCAADMYPGGNQTDLKAPGFDWKHLPQMPQQPLFFR